MKVELKKVQETIDFLSKSTWKNIAFARKYFLQYGEETITNILLVALQLTLVKDASNLLNWFVIKQISKQQESEIGMDYEFALHYKSKWFRLPIQAKIMKDDAYPELSHGVENKVTKKKEKQIDLFHEYCQKSNKAKWGLYAFYNQSDKITKLHEYWNCKGATFEDSLLGLTFVPLDIVHTKYHKKKPHVLLDNSPNFMKTGKAFLQDVYFVN